MATNEVPRGPISGYVVANIKRLRAERRWSLAELSEAMGNAGRPMLASGLHRLEQGKRRIDADDLVGLAVAFEVAPIALLLPPTAEGEIELTNEVTVAAERAWQWMRGQKPLSVPEDDDGFAEVEFHRRSIPRPLRSWFHTPAGRREQQEEIKRMGLDRAYAAGRIPPSMREAFGVDDVEPLGGDETDGERGEAT